MAYYTASEIQGGTTAAARTGKVVVRPPVTLSAAGQIVVVKSVITFLSGTNPAANDLVEMAVLPAGFTLLDHLLWTAQDWDTNGSPTLEIRMGLITGTPGDAARVIGDVGSEMRAAAAWGSAATTFERATLVTGMIAATTSDRSIGIGFTAAAATNAAIDRSINLQLVYGALRQG